MLDAPGNTCNRRIRHVGGVFLVLSEGEDAGIPLPFSIVPNGGEQMGEFPHCSPTGDSPLFSMEGGEEGIPPLFSSREIFHCSQWGDSPTVLQKGDTPLFPMGTADGGIPIGC